MEVVRTNTEVMNRLKRIYGLRLSDVLYGHWMQLSALGEAEVRKHQTKATFYRRRKQLVAAGVTWLGSDVQVITNDHTAVPRHFAPVRSNRCHVVEIDPKVRQIMNYYQAVA